MVIRGNSRGNARQLSHYLLTMKDNDAIRILDVDGQIDAKEEDMHRAVFRMGVSAELSKGDKGLYHAQINPAIGEDKQMQDEDWQIATDILGQQLGLDQQSRVIVLHTKKGRTHAHVVWERYDHQQKKMVSDSFSRLAQDRARKEMEERFAQAPTPRRNAHRPELKAGLSKLWQQHENGTAFVKAAKSQGYIISTGTGRSPFMVVDGNGRSYDLTRQLQGVRLKEVRQKLRGEILIGEKDAITLARAKPDEAGQRGGGSGKQTVTVGFTPMPPKRPENNHSVPKVIVTFKPLQLMENQNNQQQAKGQFSDNKTDMGAEQQQKQAPQPETSKQQFGNNKQDATGQQQDQTLGSKFAENRADSTKSAQQQNGDKDKEKRREEFRQRTQPKPEQGKAHDKGPERG